LQSVDTDIGLYWNFGGDVEELDSVLPGQIGYRTNASFLPEQIVGELRDLAHVNAATDYYAAFLS
jgi:hypothetical protein